MIPPEHVAFLQSCVSLDASKMDTYDAWVIYTPGRKGTSILCATPRQINNRGHVVICTVVESLRHIYSCEALFARLNLNPN